jgi:hypothetical protein
MIPIAHRNDDLSAHMFAMNACGHTVIQETSR